MAARLLLLIQADPMLLSRAATNPTQGSSYYVQFRMFSCEAFNILRKAADLILSLFHLMAGASIEAIRNNPENAMLKLQVIVTNAHMRWHQCNRPSRSLPVFLKVSLSLSLLHTPHFLSPAPNPRRSCAWTLMTSRP